MHVVQALFWASFIVYVFCRDINGDELGDHAAQYHEVNPVGDKGDRPAVFERLFEQACAFLKEAQRDPRLALILNLVFNLRV